LGTLSGVSSGLIATTQDSNWFFIDSIAVRRGEWTKPYRVQVPPHMEGAFDVRSDRIVARSQDGTVATFDASSLQPMLRSTSFGHRYWDQPTISAGNEVIAWSSSANQFADDKTVGTSNVVVLDGRDGHLLCRREVPQPADLRALGATAQRVVLMESDGHQHYTVNVYAIENEDAARARVRREVAQAKTTSAKLAPAKRAEAQGIFKQAFELFQAGEFATAARLFESGLAIDPGNVPANYYLGETYARLGNKDRAALYYTRAAAIAPTTKEGALASTRLSN
jgi:hypothetical protein